VLVVGLGAVPLDVGTHVPPEEGAFLAGMGLGAVVGGLLGLKTVALGAGGAGL